MSYTVREVSAMLGLTAGQIRAYASKGFLHPQRGTKGELRFGFQDLVVLRTAGELTAAQIPERKVRRVLQALREQLPEGRSITGVRIAADGERIVVSDGAAVWNAESGQALFDFSVSELAAKTAPLARAAAAQVHAREDDVAADEWYDVGCDLEPSDAAAARDAYTRAIALDPTHANAHVNLGRLMHEEGSPAAAARHYRAALDVDPDNATAAFNLGVALEDLGQGGDAAAAYEQAIALDPDYADAHYNLAGLLERRGDKLGAIQHLKAYRQLTSG